MSDYESWMDDFDTGITKEEGEKTLPNWLWSLLVAIGIMMVGIGTLAFIDYLMLVL